MPPATFSVNSVSRPDSVGGGDSSRNFSGSPSPSTDSVGGGGGGSSRKFSGTYGSRSIKFHQFRDIF